MLYLRWQNVVDLVVLALAIYALLRWSQEARAIRLALAILLLRIGALVSTQFHMVITPWVLDGATVVSLVVLLALFQPELRHALARLDVFRPARAADERHMLGQVAETVFSLASARRGALIVIVGCDPVEELITGGVELGGLVSSEILEAIFRKTSPVHDGAAIVRGTAVTRVGAVLPLTERSRVPKEYGTRHRAAMGLAERSDAVVVVASEERGEVTLMHGHRVAPMSSVEQLRTALHDLTVARSRGGVLGPGKTAAHVRLKLAAVGLAALIWALVFVGGNTTVRVRAVPVVFADLPPGLTVASQSAVAVETELRAQQWVFDTADVQDIVATVDLRAATAGRHSFVLDRNSFSLPGGVRLQSVSPHQLTVNLVPNRG